MPLKEARRVDVSEIARLQLHLLADPGEGLLWCLCERATVNEEIVRHLFERVLILAPGGVDELDKAGSGIARDARARCSQAISRSTLRYCVALIRAEARSVLPGGSPSGVEGDQAAPGGVQW